VTRNAHRKRMTRKRMTIEALWGDRLDVRDLRRRGFLDGGWVEIGATLWWPRIARLRIARYAILLDLRGRSIPQRIRVSWTKVHLGGERPWMHCPHCERRVVKLYRGLGGYFCRECVGNPLYASQRLSPQGRAHYRACKLRLRLDGEAQLSKPFPERPRGMHRRTYQRLRREGMSLEASLSKRLRNRFPDYASLCAYFD
jgi:hypothetical protein